MEIAGPNADSSERDRGGLSAQMQSCISSTLATALGSEADELLAAVNIKVDLLLHPLVFDWYFKLNDSMRQSGPGQEATLLAARLPQVLDGAAQSRLLADQCSQVINAPIDVTGMFGSGSCTIERAAEIVIELHGFQPNILILKELTGDQTCCLRQAFKVLSKEWPEAFDELCLFVQCIHFFQERHVIGFTDFRSHGSFYLREDYLVDPVRLAEEILHEAAHVRLNTIICLRPQFVNDQSARYSSPLRRDARPMFGVFHQMYVLARLHEYYNRLSKTENANEPRRVAILVRLREALSVVQTHAELTARGKEMIDSIIPQVENDQ